MGKHSRFQGRKRVTQFSPKLHMPRYTAVLIRALLHPLVVYITIAGNFLMLVAAGVFYYLEKGPNPQVQHLGDSLWWALVTVTTVGYGDIIPVTVEGRVVAAGLMVFGVFFFFSFTAILMSIALSQTSETLVETEELAIEETTEVIRLLKRLEVRLASLEKGLEEKGPP